MTPYERGIKDRQEGLDPQYHYPVFSQEDDEYQNGYNEQKRIEDLEDGEQACRCHESTAIRDCPNYKKKNYDY
jgi:hypothetical protein